MELKFIQAKFIRPNPKQPRREIPRDILDEMEASVKTDGLVNPIKVRSIGDGQFETVFGHIRLTAFGPEEVIPCLVEEEMTEDHRDREAWLENYLRRDLSGGEREDFIYAKWKQIGGTLETPKWEETAKSLGIHRGQYVNDHIVSKEMRRRFKSSAPDELSTDVLARIFRAGDTWDEREAILGKIERGEIAGTRSEFRNFLQTYRRAKETAPKVSKAILEGTIEPESVRQTLEDDKATSKIKARIEKEPELEDAWIQELEERKEYTDTLQRKAQRIHETIERTREEEAAEDEAHLLAEDSEKAQELVETVDIRAQEDLRRLRRIEELYDKTRWMTTADVPDGDEARARAVDLLQRIEKHVVGLLRQLGIYGEVVS